MEANVYFFAALVSTGIFLLQFILSIFFGNMDTDIDVNADGNADIDMSSVLSFKGLIHVYIGVAVGIDVYVGVHIAEKDG